MNADKLDVFRVVLDAVNRDGFRDLPDMLPHITLERTCSPEIIEDVRNHRCCSLSDLRSLGDFLLLQTQRPSRASATASSADAQTDASRTGMPAPRKVHC